MTEKIPMYLKLAHAIVSDGSSSTNEFILAELAISQHEEIERLKCERDDAYERAAQIADKYAVAACGYEFHVSKRSNSEAIAESIRALKANPNG